MKKLAQFDGATLLGLDRLTIFTEDAAEGNVLKVGNIGILKGEPFTCSEKELFKVVGLSGVDDIEHSIGLVGFNAVEDGGEVSGGIVAGTIAFADNEGLFGEALVFRVKDDEGALTFLAEPRLLQAVENPLDLVAVKTFPKDFIEGDAELVINDLKGFPADIRNRFPDGDIFFIAGLELDQFTADFVGRLRITFVGGVPFLVERFKLGDGFGGFDAGEVEFFRFNGPDEHPELRSPVADVIVLYDLGSGECEQSGDGFSDNGGANVSDVHFLGGVGRAEVNDGDGASEASSGTGAEHLFRIIGLEPVQHGHRLQGNVNESRSGNFPSEGIGIEETPFLHDVHKLLGEGTWRLAQSLGRGENAICLEVSESRISGSDDRVEGPLFETNFSSRPAKGVGDCIGRIEWNVWHAMDERESNLRCKWIKGMNMGVASWLAR